MNPKQFLIIGGALLILVGVLGMIGVVGPDASHSIFGSRWWFDERENIAHLLLGVISVIAAFVFPKILQKILVLLFGVSGFFVALYSAWVSANFLGANLENPADIIFHGVIGLWAILAFRSGKEIISSGEVFAPRPSPQAPRVSPISQSPTSIAPIAPEAPSRQNFAEQNLGGQAPRIPDQSFQQSSRSMSSGLPPRPPQMQPSSNPIPPVFPRPPEPRLPVPPPPPVPPRI